MVRVRFPDRKSETRALGFLAKRFPLTSFKSGETWIPVDALKAMANKGIPFSVEGRVRYEQIIPEVRSAAAKALQQRKAGTRRTRRKKRCVNSTNSSEPSRTRRRQSVAF